MSRNSDEFRAYDRGLDGYETPCGTDDEEDRGASPNRRNSGQRQTYGSVQNHLNDPRHSPATVVVPPQTPPDSTEAFSAAVHIVIFGLGGVALFVMSVLAVAEYNRQNTLIAAKVLSALVGVLFMLVFFFWLLVIFTYFTDRCQCLPYNSFIYSVIWAIMFLFSTCLVALLTWETDDPKKRIGLYFHKNCTGERGGNEQCLAFVVIWALASIILYKLFYCIVFVFIGYRVCYRNAH